MPYWVLDWGVNWILWLQQGSPTWDAFFRIVTLFGEEPFFFFFVPLLFWLVNRKIGVQFASLLFLSTICNVWIKYACAVPRPFLYNLQVHNLSRPLSDPSFPSGHSQAAVLTWLFLISQYPQRWIRFLGATMIVLIPLSRMYLGVHYPSDIAGGALVALFILYLSAHFFPYLRRWMAALSFLPVFMLVLLGTAVLYRLSPQGDVVAHSITCSFFGFFFGLVLEKRWVHFIVPSSWIGKVGLSLMGFPGVVLLSRSGPWLLTYMEAPLTLTIRYTCIAFWIAFCVPYGYCLFLACTKRTRTTHSNPYL